MGVGGGFVCSLSAIVIVCSNLSTIRRYSKNFETYIISIDGILLEKC